MTVLYMYTCSIILRILIRLVFSFMNRIKCNACNIGTIRYVRGVCIIYESYAIIKTDDVRTLKILTWI